MLEFTLAEDDLTAFAAHRAQESGEEAVRRKRLRLASAWIVGGLGYLFVVAISAIPLLLNGELLWAAFAELGAIAFGLFLGYLDWRRRGLLTTPLLFRRYRFKAREALAASGADRRLTLADEGFTVASGSRSTLVPWADVRRVVETPSHWFLYTSDSSAHVIPRRIGETEVAAFVAAVRSHTPEAS